MRSHGPKIRSTKATRTKLAYLDLGNKQQQPPVVHSGSHSRPFRAEARLFPAPKDRALFKSANLRELHDGGHSPHTQNSSTEVEFMDHTTSVPEEKSIYHSMMRHFLLERHCDARRAVVAFYEKFQHFFEPAHFFGQWRESSSLPEPIRRGLAPALEVLDCALMFLRLLERIEGPEVPPSSGLRILLSGVKPVLPRFQFSDHVVSAVLQENLRRRGILDGVSARVMVENRQKCPIPLRARFDSPGPGTQLRGLIVLPT